MKKILIVFFVLSLTSCSGLLWEGDIDWQLKGYEVKASNHQLYNPQMKFGTIESIGQWISTDISKISEPYGEDNWQNPEYTIKYGGDCEDLVILAMDLIYLDFGIKTSMGIVDYDGDGIVDHAVIIIDNSIHDSWNLYINKNYNIVFTLNFDTFFGE